MDVSQLFGITESSTIKCQREVTDAVIRESNALLLWPALKEFEAILRDFKL